MLIIGFDIGIKNFAYCILETCDTTRDTTRFTARDTTPTKILALENIDLQCRKNETQKIIDRTIDLLDDILNELPTTSEKIHVLIESQMTSAMKSIQTVINTFFKMQKKYQSLDIETKYLSAKHKLNLIEKYASASTNTYIPNSTISNSSYRQNKIDSVHFAKWLLGNKENKYYNEEILNKLCKAKKQDDLADALLMSIYFAES